MASATDAAATSSRTAGSTSERPRALFVGVTYAGHRTRFANLRQHVGEDGRLDASYAPITGWTDGGVIERLPLPSGARGRIRAIVQSRPFAALQRPDVIWSSAVETLTPFLWSQVGPLRRPVLLDMDWTVDQGEELAQIYFNRAPRTGMRLRAAMWQEHALWRSVDRFLPWSRWAADSLCRHGIDSSRISVIPPGVDLAQWRPSSRNPSSVLRLLFVGGDFRRKGGEILLDVLRADVSGRFELDIVTRDEVAPGENIRVHRAEANSPQLMALYAQADLFVLPTRAEAFGIATTEALASGLPAIMSNVGGAADIIDHDETGWLIEPTAESLRAALDAAYGARERLGEMGRRARAVAEARFDGARNDRAVIDHMLDAARSSAQRRRAG